MMENSCRSEIEELHQFFQDWFNGVLPETDASFARFAEVMAADFEMVAPNGRATTITALQPALRHRYNSWQNGRLSSVLLQIQPDLPNGLLWLYVHETWLPASD